jgi:periplasmic protein TonB
MEIPMFDKLVESAKEGKGRRKGRFLAVTTIIYSTVLVVCAIATIISFDPVLGKEYFLTGDVAPPIPYEAPPASMTEERQTVSTAPPKNPPPITNVHIPPQIDRTHFKLTDIHRVGDIGLKVPSNRHGNGSDSIDSSEPPPPPTRPKPTPTPEVKPQGPQKVSEGVLQGIAVRKKIPPYPEIARKIRLSGSVQVLVTISEEGRVIDATALNGHPILQQAAVGAAREWSFSPTLLSKVPVKVQGVLTFNFVL